MMKIYYIIFIAKSYCTLLIFPAVFLTSNNWSRVPEKRCIQIHHLLKNKISPVGWDCRIIHQLHLCRGIRPVPNECPRYDIKQSNVGVPAIELWGIWSTSSLPLLPIPLWFRVSPVGWDCRIVHQLHLCRGVRPPPQTSVLDMTLNNLMERFQ